MRVVSSEVIRLKLYDVADEIHTNRLSSLVFAGNLPVRTALSHVESKSIELARPPVVVDLGQRRWTLEAGSFNVKVSAHFFDIGVISLMVRFPFENLDLSEYIEKALAIDGDKTLDERFNAELEELLEEVKECVKPRRERGDFVEDFSFYLIRRAEGEISRKTLLRFPELLALLHGESRPLSEQQTALMLANSFSFFDTDLVIVNYDNALIVEPDDPADLLLLLEYAVVHVLEARYYDLTLDGKLHDLYEDMDKKTSLWKTLFSRRWGSLARRGMKLILEAQLIMEHLTSSVRVTEDVYYAQIYNRALEIFRTSRWLENVERKLQLMKDACDLLENEVHARRSTLLEWIVIILIFIEVVPLVLTVMGH